MNSFTLTYFQSNFCTIKTLVTLTVFINSKYQRNPHKQNKILDVK